MVRYGHYDCDDGGNGMALITKGGGSDSGGRMRGRADALGGGGAGGKPTLLRAARAWSVLSPPAPYL